MHLDASSLCFPIEEMPQIPDWIGQLSASLGDVNAIFREHHAVASARWEAASDEDRIVLRHLIQTSIDIYASSRSGLDPAQATRLEQLRLLDQRMDRFFPEAGYLPHIDKELVRKAYYFLEDTLSLFVTVCPARGDCYDLFEGCPLLRAVNRLWNSPAFISRANQMP